MSLGNLSQFKQKDNKPQNQYPQGEYPVEPRYVSVQPDSSLQIKFLDEGDDSDGFFVKYFHVLRRPNKWGNVGTEYKLCLDQENGQACEWCEKLNAIPWEERKTNTQYRRAVQLMTNVLVKDAPIIKKEGNQWVQHGTEDRVMVYRCGITVLDDLQKNWERLGSIKNTWFELERTGSGKDDTRYTLMPAMEGRSIKDPEENTPEQQELVDKYYIDLPTWYEEDSRGELITQRRKVEEVAEEGKNVSVNEVKNPLVNR